MRGKDAPETEKSPLVRTGLCRSADPADYNLPPSLKIIQSNGAVSLELKEKNFEKHTVETGVEQYIITQFDDVMQIEVKSFITAYEKCDVFKTFTQVINHGSEPVTLLEREGVQVMLPLSENPYLMTFRGTQYWEHTRPESYPVMHGTVKNMNCCLNHNCQEIFPGCYVSCRGKGSENKGRTG